MQLWAYLSKKQAVMPCKDMIPPYVPIYDPILDPLLVHVLVGYVMGNITLLFLLPLYIGE